MAEMTRDPLTDPWPGDVVRKGNLSRRVTGRIGHEVTYDRPSGARYDCWITTWREWCRKAEVIHAAE